jgi:peptidoglycan hydrolase-like protein with peptidoglycan-binding domain
MDTLAYTHLVSAYESPQSEFDTRLLLFRGVNWGKISGNCLMPVLAAAIGFSILGAAGAAQAALYYGDSGYDVKEVQNALAYKGYFHARSTGYFGSITKNAVKAFQSDYGLRVDGIVGPATTAALGIGCDNSGYTSYHKPSYGYQKASYGKSSGYLSRGDSSYKVTQLQNQLADYGYFHARSTGYYGSITQHAVKAFQADYGLRVDGVAGPRTLAALGL